MAEISLWKAIKACIIILLIIVIFKKILQVWRGHKRGMKSIDRGDPVDPNVVDKVFEKDASAKRYIGVTKANGEFVGSLVGTSGYPPQNPTYQQSYPPAPIEYAQPSESWKNEYKSSFQGGADDVPDPEDIKYEDDEHSSDEENSSMEGGSFFDILSKIKKTTSKKKKAAKKAVSSKKTSKKSSSKKKSKK